MESQFVRPHDTNTLVGLHSFVEGENEKKVKAEAEILKAKHPSVQQYNHVSVGDVNEGDEDDEMETDPEVHGAPIYESGTVIPALENMPHLMSTTPEVDRVPDQTIENFIRPFRAEEDPHSPTSRNDPANYQTKVSDPAGLGSQEADVSQLLRSTRKLTVESEPQSEVRILTTGTGSHDQFSPESATKSNHTNDDGEKAPTQSSYAKKIIWARAAIADKATLAKDTIISKLGFSIKAHANTTALGEGTSDRPPTKGIASVMTEKLSPVYEKVVSKVGGGGSNGGKTDEGASMKDYLAEKVKPGEEDKALSELISDALHKRKKEGVTGAICPPLGGSPRPQESGSDPETEVVVVGKGKDGRAAIQQSTI